MLIQAPITNRTAIQNVQEGKYVLPSIQREFVWGTEQIERLFDSLLRDYPINSFLLWQVPAAAANDFRFYDFLRDYHERTELVLENRTGD